MTILGSAGSLLLMLRAAHSMCDNSSLALGGSAIDPMQPSGFGESSGPTHEILRESEERFRLLVEGVKDYAIFMLDADGYISTWNLGAQRIKGYESEECERLLTREQAALERATDILERISDAFFAVDEDCRFTYING